jgi:uncharacterized protein (TIGR02118 family)
MKSIKTEKVNWIMPTKISVIYDNPLDPIAFEEGYSKDQITLAKALPGIERIEATKVWPPEDGSATPAYRTIDLYFTDYDTASSSVTTVEAEALFKSIFSLATGGVRILFCDIEN